MMLDILYKELRERMAVLEQRETKETHTAILDGRIAELQLCIIRVQQILLDEIESKKRSDEEYQRFVEYRIKRKLPQMTRTQSEFARFLCTENVSKEIIKTGDMPGMFKEVWKHFRGFSQD